VKKQKKPTKKIIFVSSRLRGDIENNIKLAECLCRIVVLRGYVPIAPHIIFTRFLDDTKPGERELGISCGLELLKLCDELWCFDFSGISEGMHLEIDEAKRLGIKIRHFRDCEVQ